MAFAGTFPNAYNLPLFSVEPPPAGPGDARARDIDLLRHPVQSTIDQSVRFVFPVLQDLNRETRSSYPRAFSTSFFSAHPLLAMDTP